MSTHPIWRYKPAAASVLDKRPSVCAEPFANVFAPAISARNQEALS